MDESSRGMGGDRGRDVRRIPLRHQQVRPLLNLTLFRNTFTKDLLIRVN